MLGDGIKHSYFWRGTSNDHLLDLLIPINGSKAQGSLHVKALRENGKKWHWILFLVELPNDEVVDLFYELVDKN